MEEISETAKAYHSNVSKKQRRLANDLFKEMDKDGDGTISFDEYEQFIKQKKGYKTISTQEFFKKLDKDGNGRLDFDEFLTVHYICASERVLFCDECKAFLDRVYFTCVQCFNGSANTYDVCVSCYRDKNINHHKDALFLDNYTLLHAKRNQKTGQGRGEASEGLKVAAASVETTAEIVNLCSQM